MITIPTIDLDDEESAELKAACENVGCFFAKAPSLYSLVAGVIKEARMFFELDPDVKGKYLATSENYFVGYRPQGSEKNMYGTQTEHCEQFKLGMIMQGNGSSLCQIEDQLSNRVFNTRKTLQYWNEATTFSNRLLDKMRINLGFEAAYFDKYLDQPLHQLGLNYYPSISNIQSGFDSDYALSPHVDLGLFTLISQDIAGLQIQLADETLVGVEPQENTVLVLLAEYLHKWSGGRYRAPLHCVTASKKERYSVIYKHRPNYDAVIRVPYRASELSDSEFINYHTGEAYDRKIHNIMGVTHLPETADP